MRIATILLIVALVTSIVMFIKEYIDAKKENRKMNPWYAVVFGVVVACAVVFVIGRTFLFLITWAIVANM